MSDNKYNLDISTYSLNDILNLFKIDLQSNITVDDLKNAKKRTLMMHPDKSKLDSKYYLFYKKALYILIRVFNENNRQNQDITENNTQYKDTTKLEADKSIKKSMDSMNPEQFQKWFNKQFDDNMVQKSKNNKNDWFSDDKPIYKINENISANNLGREFDNFKQNNAGLIIYKDVENLTHSSGSNLYEDDDDPNSDSGNTYVCSDPFSKLKYDDLRKVHKDQTIFAVSERDIVNVKQYSSMDQYRRERGSQTFNPIEKTEAEEMFRLKEIENQSKMSKLQYNANMRTDAFKEKNKSIMSSFLNITN